MKDLLRLAGECQMELQSIGIRCGQVRNWSVNTRAKARWGLCTKISKAVFDIQISAALLQDDVEEQAAKDTIAHELLHTVPGCFNHTGQWKQYAAFVNARLPQYSIKARSSFEDKGVADDRPTPVYRYGLKCLRCGAEILRQKKSAAVEHPERYRCKCGGRLIRLK